jgi:Matrixin
MICRSLALALAALVFAAFPAAATASSQTASATGVANVQGKNVLVEVFVEVPRGQSARQATDAALAEQGAQPQPPPGAAGPGGPGFTGLVWDVLPVRQSYNPAGEPVFAQSLLQATQAAWSSVPGSRFRMSFGGRSTRCPSIVRECPGPQMLDGYNDVGWARLSGSTLGVTWSTIGGTDEADMALSTGVPWSTSTACVNVAGRVDVQSVLLHENGHVAGLGHAASTASVMYPFYQGARCSLGVLDQQAIQTLYPSS